MATFTFEYSKEETTGGQVHGLQYRVDVPELSVIDYATLREVEKDFLEWFSAENQTHVLIEWKATTEAQGVLSHYRSLLPYGAPKFPATEASVFFEQTQSRSGRRSPSTSPEPSNGDFVNEVVTSQEREMLSEYQLLMNEVKYRFKLILQLLKHDAPYPDDIIKEFCFLQIRMVCELVGLGCLLAHAGIKGAQTSQLRKAWSPERIISELEKLHPNFFPEAFTLKKTPDGGISIAIENKPGYLTKDELITLHGLCGQVLHRGSIERLRARAPAPRSGRKETVEWTQKLLNLLDRHVIFLSGMDKMIACEVRIFNPKPVATTFHISRPAP